MIDAPQIVVTKAQHIAVLHLVIPRERIRDVMGPGVGEVMKAIPRGVGTWPRVVGPVTRAFLGINRVSGVRPRVGVGHRFLRDGIELRRVCRRVEVARRSERDVAKELTMITVRPAAARGRSDFGWLDSRHTFSFGEYHDGAHMGFRALRVLNDDRVEKRSGFGAHPHRDMEIISYVLDGALGHEDNTGHGSTIRPGDVQRMTAGTGITHSEWNHSESDAVHFLQIRIVPDRRGLTPGYEQRSFAPDELRHRLRLVASPDGRDGSVTVHQDVAVHAGKLSQGDRVAQVLAEGRHAWLQVARGGVSVNGVALAAGDGAAISEIRDLEIIGKDAESEVLLFDLA